LHPLEDQTFFTAHHLDFYKSLEHFAFDFLARPHQSFVVFRSSLLQAWFEPIGAISDALQGDGFQDLHVQGFSMSGTTMGLVHNQWLKGFENLKSCFETDGARQNSMLGGCLSHDRANQVVRQDVCPYLLADEFWRLAA
jgi:hypothetical protein